VFRYNTYRLHALYVRCAYSPYVSSSYYTSTKSIQTLLATEENQVVRNLRREAEEAAGADSTGPATETKTRLAIVRPFCEFDAEALPTTFTCWNALPPCKAASADVGDDDMGDLYDEVDITGNGELLKALYKNSNDTAAGSSRNNLLFDGVRDRHMFDLVGSDATKNAKADVFLFYSHSQTFSLCEYHPIKVEETASASAAPFVPFVVFEAVPQGPIERSTTCYNFRKPCCQEWRSWSVLWWLRSKHSQRWRLE